MKRVLVFDSGIGGLSVLDAIVATHGDAARGAQLFVELNCNACHTTRANEPLKGPFLGTIANT